MTVRRLMTALAALAVLGAMPAGASPNEVSRALPDAQKVGEAAYSLLSIRHSMPMAAHSRGRDPSP